MSNLPKSLKDAIYVVPRYTTIMVSNSALVLTSHTMKKAMFFDNTCLLVGTKMKNHEEVIYPFVMPATLLATMRPDRGRTKITVTQLFIDGYFTFETGNATWPWLVAPKSLFDVTKPKKIISINRIGGQGRAWDH